MDDKEYDLAMSQHNDTGEILLHRVDCTYVRWLADNGHQVLTMLGCKGPMPAEYKKHSCLEHETEIGRKSRR